MVSWYSTGWLGAAKAVADHPGYFCKYAQNLCLGRFFLQHVYEQKVIE